MFWLLRQHLPAHTLLFSPAAWLQVTATVSITSIPTPPSSILSIFPGAPVTKPIIIIPHQLNDLNNRPGLGPGAPSLPPSPPQVQSRYHCLACFSISHSLPSPRSDLPSQPISPFCCDWIACRLQLIEIRLSRPCSPHPVITWPCCVQSAEIGSELASHR